jgi:predicted amidohydrolase YtcJ
MVILSKNPTMVPAEEIKDIKVHMTVIGGKVAWEG